MLRRKMFRASASGLLACWIPSSWMAVSWIAACTLLVGSPHPAFAQDRETKVRNDRRQLAEDESWLYNDLETGFAAARASGRPMLIVLRCIP